MDKALKWIWLTSLKGIHSSKITALLDKFDSIDDIYAADESDYENISLIGQKDIISLCDKSTSTAEKIIERTEEAGGYVICFDSEIYPQKLKRLFAPPYVLYVKGNSDILDAKVNVGVVGTRKYTDYGRAVTAKMCYDFALAGLTVVSGMARGIDSIAASSALKAGAETIAVIGCGIDIPYPAENEKLMNSIAEHGVVISEYPPLTQPYGSHFPERNRIIAALSDCLLVTEAPRGSGALITAKYAHEMGIDIFSVPGSIFDYNSVGNNKLIKAGAKIALNSRDIIDEFAYLSDDLKKPEPGTNFLKENLYNLNSEKREKDNVQTKTIDDEQFSLLSEDEKKVAGVLINTQKASVDEIIRASGLTANKVNSILPLLEIEGIVEKFAGNIYSLT